MNIMNKLRKNILKASFETQAGHIPSAFSILEIIYTIYKNHITNDEVFGEGFFLYYFKDEVDINLPEN